MAQGGTARFFSPKVALLALGLLAGGGGFGAYCILRVIDDHRISIGGFLLSGALVLGAVAAFAMAFPKGCRTCKQAFDDAEARFSPAVYDHLLGAVQSGNPGLLMQLIQAPPALANQWSELTVSYCKTCRQLGEARIVEERNNGQYDEYVRGSSSFPLSPQMLGAALTLIQQRGGSL
jgi:hypothetical protein